MPDLLLTHGYFLYEDPKEMQIMKPYAPLGILYLCSHLRQRGFDVEVFDTTFSSRESLFRHLQTAKPSTLGVYANLMTRSNVVEIIRVAREGGWRVIVGGPEPGAYAQEFLESGADFVVFGEGESTMEELLTAIRGGSDTSGHVWKSKIAGTAYLDDEGAFHQNPPRMQIADLDAQPWPAREAIDLHRYVNTWRTHHQQGSVNFITARGCPYKCRWCSHQVYGQTHRRRNPIKVVDELEWLLTEYTPDIAWVSDDVFTINHEWIRKYAAEMRRRKLHIPFECISRADRLNEEMLDLLAELGCFRIWIGSESGSQRLLDAMDRGVKVEQVQRAIEMSRARKIQSGMFLMWGYEGEEMEDIEATIRHVSKSKPDIFFTTVSYPIKGTPYYHQVQSKLVQVRPWAQTSDREIRIAGRHSRAYYAHADKLLRDEVQLVKLSEDRGVNSALIEDLRGNIQASRDGLLATWSEVEA
jgi:anaerobic magnesium-protoporphyrin IX monomethyl ester cyclase